MTTNFRKNNPAKRKYPKAAKTLVATNPNLTAAERGLVQSSNREKLMARLDGDTMVNKIADIIENEDPDKYSSAEKALALKIATGMVFGDSGTDSQKNPQSAVQITISGIGAPPAEKEVKDSGDSDRAAVTISGIATEVKDDG